MKAMKKMITTLLALSMVFAVAMSSVLAEEPDWTFSNGIRFNMDMDQVIELMAQPRYEIENEKTRGTTEFWELEYEDIHGDEGLTADIKYLFVGNSLVAFHFDFADGTAYETVKTMLADYGEAVPFDAAKIGNGKYAVDDDGNLKDCVEMIEANGLMIVLEKDRDGDVDVTFLDSTAAYINN